MTNQELQRRAKALFDYLQDVVKLGLKVIRTVDEHADFLLFQQELPQADGIMLWPFSDDRPWLEVRRQIIADPPEPPENLKDWVEVSIDPDKEPRVIEQKQINGKDVSFYDDKSRQSDFSKYFDFWQRWATEVRPNKKVQSLYTELFRVYERLKYDEQFELVWGYGLLLWKYSEYTIKYPVIIQQMAIEHKAGEGIIDVLPRDDAEPRLEFDALADLSLPDLSEVRKLFQESQEKQIQDVVTVKEDYLGILKETVGRLSTDGLLVNLSGFHDLTPTNKLRLVDCWVLFVRKRQQDAVIRDIEAFRTELKTKEPLLPGGLLPFLSDADNTGGKEDEAKARDEWSALLDKQVLFPLPANQEQIQILDRIECADGVVVWGPPGTGKSHTIANLLCHFMAEGKRVLVTTQKDQALAVLHDMIPQDLRPLCISVLSNVRDSREKLEGAINKITEIVTQSLSYALQREIQELENKIGQCREELVGIQREVEDLARAQLTPIIDKGGGFLLPAELAGRMKKDEGQHAWLKDTPTYETETKERGGKVVIQIVAKPPISVDEVEELKTLRELVLPLLEELSYELPATTDLVDGITFSKMVEDAQKIALLEESINQHAPGLIFKDENNEALGQAIAELKHCLETYKSICEDWQRSLLTRMRLHPLDAERIKKAGAELTSSANKVRDYFTKKDLLKNITLGDVATVEDLPKLVTNVVARVKRGRKPYGLFDFGRKKKQILKRIRVNDRPPSCEEDWEAVSRYVELIVAVKKLKYEWNYFARNIGAPEIPDSEAELGMKRDAETLLSLIESLNAPIVYETVQLPKLREALSLVVEEAEKVLTGDSLDKLYKAVSLKKEQGHFQDSKTLSERLVGNLQQIISRGRCHPVVLEMMTCLNNLNKNLRPYEAIVEDWKAAYERVKTLEALSDSYKRFSELVDRLKKHAPDWAENWKRRDIAETELCPSYWQESWEYHALRKYLEDISSATQKIAELQSKQEELTRTLSRTKEKLVLAKTKLGLIRNISDTHLQALKKWRLAIRKYGKGTGKWAPWWKRVAQEEMRQAQNVVPVWIMPLYRVSETIPSEFGIFDVVIVDEASQCDVRAFLALARGKKVIVVGDPEQISPEAVGIPEADVQRLIKQHLNEIPGGRYFDLRTGLYYLAEITFTGQGTLMLREHFRCVPEIIQFSNQLCYHGEIIPLRNPPPAQRLDPVLQSVFVEGGYREGRQDLNKPEARALCEKLKQMVGDPRYKGKTFGVISLTGYDQARYIFNIVGDYLTPEQREACKFRVGDAYAFQGDERDVMLLSMVVGSNDEKRLIALAADVYRQRFNVAVSRARDQLIVFHSVRLAIDLKNPEDLRYKLLDFVQNGIPPLGGSKALCQSPFEEAVYDWLTKRGYYVSPQVPVGAKRIDLVIEGVNARLAVECDGDKWHLPEKWWEDWIRERQLRRAGWTICRIWGSAFYREPDSAMAPVLSKLGELGIRPTMSFPVSEEHDTQG